MILFKLIINVEIRDKNYIVTVKISAGIEEVIFRRI